MLLYLATVSEADVESVFVFPGRLASYGKEAERWQVTGEEPGQAKSLESGLVEKFRGEELILVLMD